MNPLQARMLGVALIALWLAVPMQVPASQNKPRSAAAAADTVSGSGCVEAGVEAGCLVLSDSKTKTLYNLLITGKKPALGSAIHFTGTKHDGPTTCMQGQAVKVEKWEPIKMKCAAAEQK